MEERLVFYFINICGVIGSDWIAVPCLGFGDEKRIIIVGRRK